MVEPGSWHLQSTDTSNADPGTGVPTRFLPSDIPSVQIPEAMTPARV